MIPSHRIADQALETLAPRQMVVNIGTNIMTYNEAYFLIWRLVPVLRLRWVPTQKSTS